MAASIIVRIPELLRSYTAGAPTVEVQMADAKAGKRAQASVDGVLRELDRRFPGLRFRIVDEQAAVRPHVKLFLDGVLVRDLGHSVNGAADLMIVGALSGG